MVRRTWSIASFRPRCSITPRSIRCSCARWTTRAPANRRYGMRRKQSREVVYVERGGDASAKWLFWGALLGAGLALLYAPRSGEETRRLVQRRLWKLRAMTEEKLDEFSQQLGGRGGGEFSEPADDDDDDLEPEGYGNGLGRGSGGAARQDIERRLTEARSRRRAASADVEEPLA